MVIKLHPQRCETCKHCRNNPNDNYYCLVMQDDIDFLDFDRTAKVGCASYNIELYQCGDNCKGECSGKVTEESICPCQDTIDKPQPHPVWFDKYICFGEKYGSEPHCPHCKDWWQCKYEYFDERF